MTETVCAVVPLKTNSRRLPNKNFLYLDGVTFAHRIFRTLIGMPDIDTTYVFCSDPELLEHLPSGLTWLPRPARLDGHAISANELFGEAIRQVTEDIVLLAQAPGPFVSEDTIVQCLDAVRESDRQTAITVQRHQTYAWFRGKPLNFNPLDIAQTQQLEPVFTETSGIYAFRRSFFVKTGRRVSSDPVFIEVDDLEATDIDTAEDFKVAEMLATGRRFYRESSSVSLVRNEGAPTSDGPEVRHIAFSLDGVLVDSLSVMERSWDSATKRSSLDIPFREFRQSGALPFEQRLQSLGVPASKRAELTSDYETTATLLSDDISLNSGVLPGLDALRANGYSISVLTPENRQWAMTITSKLLLGFVDALICGNDPIPRRCKPHPDPLLYACVSHEVDPCETLYVGDSLADLQCANQAGVTYVHAAWGHGQLDGFSRLWFDSFENFIASLFQA